MIRFLADHNIEGQALNLWGVLAKEGWLELLSMQLVTFTDIGLSFESSDREVWRFAQTQGMVLLTDNRNMKGEDSLEQTIREENGVGSYPVITISNVGRMDEKGYRERCAERIVEIGVNIKKYLGTGRLFIP